MQKVLYPFSTVQVTTNFRDPFKLCRHYWHSGCQDYSRHTDVMHGSHLWQKESWI